MLVGLHLIPCFSLCNLLSFLLTHPYQNKVAIIENLVDRDVSLSHKFPHSENLKIIRRILILNQYPQNLIEKHAKIRLEQSRIRKFSDLGRNSAYKVSVFNDFNIFDLPYFRKMSKTFQLVLKKFRIHANFRILFKMVIIITLSKDLMDRLKNKCSSL